MVSFQQVDTRIATRTRDDSHAMLDGRNPSRVLSRPVQRGKTSTPGEAKGRKHGGISQPCQSFDRPPYHLIRAMTIPPLDLQYPLCAESLPGERLPAPGADATPLLLALVRQAFSLIRSSQAWKKGKTFGQKDDPGQGGSVQSLYCPSDMDGRLKKCAWHARHSRHNPADSGLSFEDLHDGLGTDQHTLNEAEYIHDIIETIRIAEVIPGRAEVWRNSCESASRASFTLQS